MPRILTQDFLTWYEMDVRRDQTNDLLDISRDAEFLVETLDGYRLVRATAPFPTSAFRWARLPMRVLR